MLDRPPKVLADRARQRRAAWMRTYRRRIKAGLVVVPVEVDSAILDLLCRTGWLAESGASDKAAIGRAIAEILRDASTRRALDRR
jgi:hypothetical protein